MYGWFGTRPTGEKVRLVREEYSNVPVVRHGPPMLWHVLKLPMRYYTGRYRMMEPAHEPREDF